MVSPKLILKNFYFMKKLIMKMCQKSNPDIAIKAMTNAAKYMYSYNIIYSDCDLEEAVLLLSNKMKVSCKIKQENKKQNTILFYDYFAWDNRGLTLIYLKALLKKKVRIVYVTYKKNDCFKMEKIKELLLQHEGNKLFFLPEDVGPAERITCFDEIINSEMPEKILLHTAPWDIEGMVAVAKFNGMIEKYMINITDHAFWIGEKVSDYILEFRNYGYNISKKYRGSEEKKSILLPFYPVRQNNEFAGFPFHNWEEKRIIFTGGSLYKIAGSTVYYDVVNYILDKYKDTILFFLGNGDEHEFQEFIKRNQYEDRCFLCKERNDFEEVLKRCYFYLSTYPLIGGLMTQYAVLNGKIPLALAEPGDYCNWQEDLLIDSGKIKLTFRTLDELKNEIDRLMSDSTYYDKQTKMLENLLFDENEFAENLYIAIDQHTSRIEKKDLKIDIQKFYQQYIERTKWKENFVITLKVLVYYGISIFYSIFKKRGKLGDSQKNNV